MEFVVNLSTETLATFAGIDQLSTAFLLSAHRVTPSLLDAAAQVRRAGVRLFADNGTKPLIEKTVDEFRAPAAALREDIKQLRRQLGHVPRGAEIPAALRNAADDLATTVVAAATARSDALDAGALLETQLSMQPTELFAQEDFATACLIALDLERETTGWRVARLATRVRRSLRLWRRVNDDPACAGIRVYAVLSAMDYNTARRAGQLAAEAGVRHAAVGVAGINLDPSAVDFYVMGTATHGLDKAVPRRYVRLAQILRGIADGYRDCDRVPESFHCLGLGASSMFPIAAGALDGATSVLMDATSPIHDAVRDRVLYDPAAQGQRASTRKIVERILAGGSWPFVSPFTQRFRERSGHDPAGARRWWHEHGRPPIDRAVLTTPSALTRALPLFCEADGQIRRAAQQTWIAHNHWVLGQLCHALKDGAARSELALAAIDIWLSGPATVTTRGLDAARRVLRRPAPGS